MMHSLSEPMPAAERNDVAEATRRRRRILRSRILYDRCCEMVFAKRACVGKSAAKAGVRESPRMHSYDEGGKYGNYG